VIRPAKVGGGPASALRLAVAALGNDPGTGRAAWELSRRLGARSGVAPVVPVEMFPRDGPRRDPFGVRCRVARLDAEAVVVVAPTRWGPRRVVPAAVVGGRPVGLVQADGPGDLPPERPVAASAAAPWLVTAMGKDVFLEPTEHWAETLNSAGRRARDLRADRARRDDLVAALRSGPGVVLYAGHGRTRGWSGYQGLRWRHLRPEGDTARPAGVMVAFACDTLKRSRSRVAFGSRLVASGVARAYLGAVGSIRTADAEVLSELVVRHLAWGAIPTVAELVRSVGEAVADEPSARAAWRSFRLLGDPSTRLTAA